ncbi:Transcription elongation factor 1 [Tolypocladium capitatum]|uniref:Transcription elongation factor 1 homolog n=1 Tax=Tolypocladium capitatum TaxID=45235 RepID=A0A2K3QAE2_9HYPO|nr:Transcription elongation factor 1 [Tolypocladium capitatum]
MGKRKKSSRKPMGPKRADPLPSTFTCLFCNHEKSVTVKLDRKAGVGQLDCRVCGQKFQCAVNCPSHRLPRPGAASPAIARPRTTGSADIWVVAPCLLDLSAAVDVYGEWVDAADTVAKEATGDVGYEGITRTPASSKRYPNGAAPADEHDEGRYQGDGIDADDEEY